MSFRHVCRVCPGLVGGQITRIFLRFCEGYIIYAFEENIIRVLGGLLIQVIDEKVIRFHDWHVAMPLLHVAFRHVIRPILLGLFTNVG